ncbi:hypothetical protein [Umezawaea beigongshangensis]|uniref:hypothetical protein n=1 Tax=Umezawaea beigongshangensis TaxID=2780383 RepID=UPI0027DD640A|nr:hypothetical protein [Umezawaea beigongshangensis]
MTLLLPGDVVAATLFPELQRLLDARWRFLPIEPGTRQVDGVRLWPGRWRDGIRVASATDALGIRTDPDGGLVWELTGLLPEVVDELLELPPPGTRLAPHLVIGRGPR